MRVRRRSSRNVPWEVEGVVGVDGERRNVSVGSEAVADAHTRAHTRYNTGATHTGGNDAKLHCKWKALSDAQSPTPAPRSKAGGLYRGGTFGAPRSTMLGLGPGEGFGRGAARVPGNRVNSPGQRGHGTWMRSRGHESAFLHGDGGAGRGRAWGQGSAVGACLRPRASGIGHRASGVGRG